MCEQRNLAPKYLVWFLISLTGIIVVFLFVIVWSNVQFRKSRTDLFEALNTHVVNTKGLLDVSHGMYANHQKCVIEGVGNLIDSLSKQPVKNQKMLILSLKSCLDEIKDLEVAIDNSELRHEFELIKNDIDVTLEYLNSHVQLHIDKMNSSVSTFELWAAVLTIIFLVFSFYSLYKVDELVKQGREGVDSIKKLKKEGENSVLSFNSKSTDALDSMNEQIKNAIDEQSNLMLEKYDLMDASLKERTSDLSRVSDQIMKELADYKSKIAAESIEIEARKKRFNEYVSKSMEDFDRRVELAIKTLNENNNG